MEKEPISPGIYDCWVWMERCHDLTTSGSDWANPQWPELEMELFQTLKAPMRLPSRSLPNTLVPWFLCLFICLFSPLWVLSIDKGCYMHKEPQRGCLTWPFFGPMKCLLKERPGWGSYILKPPGVRGQVDPGLSRKKEEEVNDGDEFQAKVERNGSGLREL